MPPKYDVGEYCCKCKDHKKGDWPSNGPCRRCGAHIKFKCRFCKKFLGKAYRNKHFEIQHKDLFDNYNHPYANTTSNNNSTTIIHNTDSNLNNSTNNNSSNIFHNTNNLNNNTNNNSSNILHNTNNFNNNTNNNSSNSFHNTNTTNNTTNNHVINTNHYYDERFDISDEEDEGPYAEEVGAWISDEEFDLELYLEEGKNEDNDFFDVLMENDEAPLSPRFPTLENDIPPLANNERIAENVEENHKHLIIRMRACEGRQYQTDISVEGLKLRVGLLENSRNTPTQSTHQRDDQNERDDQGEPDPGNPDNGHQQNENSPNSSQNTQNSTTQHTQNSTTQNTQNSTQQQHSMQYGKISNMDLSSLFPLLSALAITFRQVQSLLVWSLLHSLMCQSIYFPREQCLLLHLQEQENRLQEQENRLQEQENHLREQENRLQEQEKRLQEQGSHLLDQREMEAIKILLGLVLFAVDTVRRIAQTVVFAFSKYWSILLVLCILMGTYNSRVEFSMDMPHNTRLVQDRTIERVLDDIVRVMEGPIARGIITTAIWVQGVGLFLGKLGWGHAIVTSGGMAMVFGSTSVIKWSMM